MFDAFEKLLSILILVIALFIVPFVFLSSFHDSTTESVVYSITSDFVNDVRTQGKITQDMYMDYMQSLDRTGLLFSIEMKHVHFVESPIFDSQSGGVNRVVGTSTDEEIYYTDDILEGIFATKGIYTMNKNDTFTIVITNKDKTLSQNMREMVFRLPETTNAIYVTCGGMIRDENY